MNGAYREHHTDAHVALRGDLLSGTRTLPAPPVHPIHATSSRITAELLCATQDALGARGIAVILLDDVADDEWFIGFGQALGTPIPELAPAVQPHVGHSVILNLVSEYGRTEDVDLQPFSTNFLSLHTESSGRPVRRQPRYLALMCCDPGGADSAAQTILVPNGLVANRIAAPTQHILRGTRYRSNVDGPYLMRSEGDRVVFSFRDFMSDTLEWTHEGGVSDVDKVNSGIRALLAAMYAREGAFGTTWVRGMILILDNTHFFHGRTAGREAAVGQRRHLKRLRIAVAEQLPAAPRMMDTAER